MNWLLEDHLATLRSEAFNAQVDLRFPSRGLVVLSLQAESLPNTEILGTIWREREDPSAAPTDRYVRGTDLVASYSETPDCPVSTEIYWRAWADASAGVLGAELWISAQTQLLDSLPQIRCTSLLPQADVLRLNVPDSDGSPAVPMDDAAVAAAAFAPGAFLFRPHGRSWSYCQLVQPADFLEQTVTLSDQPGAGLRLAYVVFQDHLEKGVIRRARVRGLFLPRERDAALAATAYQEFVASRLPLNT
jgi:hypothetical protein